MGIIANVLAGLIGSSVGQSLFWVLGDHHLWQVWHCFLQLQELVIVVCVVSFFLGKKE